MDSKIYLIDTVLKVLSSLKPKSKISSVGIKGFGLNFGGWGGVC